MRRLASRRTGIAAAVAAGALLVAGAGPAQAEGAAADGCAPGAAGIGDPYFPTDGNGGYDVRRYDLDLRYDPATDRLDGEATLRAAATQDLCTLNLDLVGLEVRAISVDGRPATFTRADQELVVTPQRELREGRRFRVVVEYGGVPTEFQIPGTDLRSGVMATADGLTIAGQPDVAAAWFPVNDHPLDKAAYAFDVTVPGGVEVVANGHLRGVRRQADGWTTWRWRAREPMASYLATVDIGAWDVRRWRTDDGLPVYDAVDPALTGELRAQIDSSLARQGEVLDVLDDAFGPYPFSTVGAIVESQDDLLFALETQTRPVYSKAFWLDAEGQPTNGDPVVVHELAHQWFGDDVALARWQDIWLNEGPATYAEWLWAEHEGQATPAEILRTLHEAIPADDPFWQVVIGDPGVDLLFDAAVYYRGAMTLQALREEVGDRAFFRILRAWTRTRSGGHGTTPEFVALAERVAGRELDALFTAWLLTPGRPALPAADAAARATASRHARAWLHEARGRLAHGQR